MGEFVITYQLYDENRAPIHIAKKVLQTAGTSKEARASFNVKLEQRKQSDKIQGYKIIKIITIEQNLIELVEFLKPPSHHHTQTYNPTFRGLNFA